MGSTTARQLIERLAQAKVQMKRERLIFLG
jgi:hypothetical protein